MKKCKSGDKGRNCNEAIEKQQVEHKLQRKYNLEVIKQKLSNIIYEGDRIENRLYKN